MKLSTRIVLASAVLAAPLALASPAFIPTPFDSPMDNAAPRATEFRTEARFDSAEQGSSPHGKARYRERQRGYYGVNMMQRFTVDVQDAQPGEEFVVTVNGMMIGTLIANDLGRAELEFRTAAFIDSPDDGTPIPSGFPRIEAGATITVGDMVGTFEAR
ncbi:MAG: hypothetical protein H6813_05255 [Phycisphaeraceae bacterium]|nr:hypothetical protein [Phycisphaeraceae bacterium]MCB9847791.1 hypothetical protein [Phycisphaeraceae bacterium]